MGVVHNTDLEEAISTAKPTGERCREERKKLGVNRFVLRSLIQRDVNCAFGSLAGSERKKEV